MLEAIACGLTPICTKGGATDDFTRDDYSLRIDNKLETLPQDQGYRVMPDLDHLINLMRKAIEDREFMRSARKCGIRYVHSHYTWKHIVDQLCDKISL